MATNQDKSNKSISKQLRLKANEFLSSRRNSNIIIDLLTHFESGNNQSPCLLTLELIFIELLKRGDMYQEIVPLKPIDDTPDNQYKCWLRKTYDDAFSKILDCLECNKNSIQIQALSTAMKILSYEGKYPLEPKGEEYYFPIQKLKLILMKILSSEKNNAHIFDKFQEYTVYLDVLYYTWKCLPPLTPKTHPNDTFILNYLNLVDKLKLPNGSGEMSPNIINETGFCQSENNMNFIFDQVSARKSLNKAWSCVMHWELTINSHKQLLIVLIERIMPYLDKPIALTDFLMDSLDAGGPIGLLALQGVFILVQQYHLEYPNIFTKLYSMFEPEIFHTKYKARLLYLSDIFLSSTHLPETLVAAFAKRLARLSLVVPQEDIPAICTFIGNLMVRHPGLKRLMGDGTLSTEITKIAPSHDPYIMEERDPLRSNAMFSSLWEIKTLQSHILPEISNAAKQISDPIPTVERDMGSLLDRTASDIFDKEIKKRGKEIALAFDRPPATRIERVSQYWRFM